MKSSISRLVIAGFLVMLFALSCTLPFYVGTPEPVKETVIVEVTSTPAQPPVEPTQVGPTPTVSVNLDGSWTIWYGSDEKQIKISFLQKGYSLVGNAATDDGNSLLFDGTISQAGVSVTGTWESTNGTSGNFVMQLGTGLTTFSGNLGGGVPFCGSRSGAKPSPCLD